MRPTLTLSLLCLALSACAAKGGAYIGTWDDGGGAMTTIAKSGRSIAVTSVVDDDGETFEVRGYRLDGSALILDYHVPSTNYDVHIVCGRPTGDDMSVLWSNSAGATGSEIWTRKD